MTAVAALQPAQVRRETRRKMALFVAPLAERQNDRAPAAAVHSLTNSAGELKKFEQLSAFIRELRPSVALTRSADRSLNATFNRYNCPTVSRRGHQINGGGRL